MLGGFVDDVFKICLVSTILVDTLIKPMLFSTFPEVSPFVSPLLVLLRILCGSFCESLWVLL